MRKIVLLLCLALPIISGCTAFENSGGNKSSLPTFEWLPNGQGIIAVVTYDESNPDNSFLLTFDTNRNKIRSVSLLKASSGSSGGAYNEATRSICYQFNNDIVLISIDDGSIKTISPYSRLVSVSSSRNLFFISSTSTGNISLNRLTGDAFESLRIIDPPLLDTFQTEPVFVSDSIWCIKKTSGDTGVTVFFDTTFSKIASFRYHYAPADYVSSFKEFMCMNSDGILMVMNLETGMTTVNKFC